MKTYVFDGISGVVARIEASSMDEAIKIFNCKYIGKCYGCIYEE